MSERICSPGHVRPFEPVVLILGVIVAFGTFWCWGLGARSFWNDEALSHHFASEDPGALVTSLRNEVHPPFYFAVLKVWKWFAGDSEGAMRLLSVIFALATVAGMPLLVRAAIAFENGKSSNESARAGLIAALLYAACPMVFRFAREARMYTCGAALAVFGSWALLRGVRAEGARSRWWLIYVAARTAGLYTHHWLWMTLAADLCYFSCKALKDKTRTSVTDFAFVASGSLAAITLFTPWMSSLARQALSVQKDYWISPMSAGEFLTIPFRLFWLLDVRTDGALAMCVLLFAATIAALVHAEVRCVNRYLLAGAALPCIIGLVYSWLVGRSVIADRFLFFSHTHLIAACACILGAAPGSTRRSLAVLASFGSLLGATIVFRCEWEGRHLPGIRAALAEFYEANGADARLFATSDFAYVTSRYYFPDVWMLRRPDMPWDNMATVDLSRLVDPGELKTQTPCWIISLQNHNRMPELPPGTELTLVGRWSDLYPLGGRATFVTTAWELYRLSDPSAKPPLRNSQVVARVDSPSRLE